MPSCRPAQHSPTGITRRALVAGAASGLVAASHLTSTPAQSVDPFTYIRSMEATTDLGQRPGQPASEIEPVAAGGWYWDAYIQLPIKEGQDFHYTCEFDSAWIILKAYGFEVGLDEQMSIVGVDDSLEPYYEETAEGFKVYGGDVNNFFCGHINENILARARTNAMRKVFEAKGLAVTQTPTRDLIEAALLRGEPVFFKSTVDMLPWRAATWYTPDGEEYPVVLTNDHALIVMGCNPDEVIVRDPLGPTSTNWERPWQWRVRWDRFIEVLAAQGNDAIAIAPSTT